ncbi:MAG: hypothetical protein GY828_04115 [Candidatus Gracilibacteria bacterium]|nr:hypothetical protein [Candidatus Gracilibacteria bacterium]
MKINKNGGYSVIVAVLVIGFLLVLTITVYNLVLRELHDNRSIGDGIKAFAGAESAQELALLEIKEHGYGFDNTIQSGEEGSKILAKDPENFSRNKDVALSYALNILAEKIEEKYIYTEVLGSDSYSIIPLFYETSEEGETYLKSYQLLIEQGAVDDLVWNLVSANDGIGGTGRDTQKGKGKRYEEKKATYFTSTVSAFLKDSESYLILYNSGNNEIEFKLQSGDKFSKPKTTILSSAEIKNAKYNISTEYDNTEFLNILKYAVFSQ